MAVVDFISLLLFEFIKKLILIPIPILYTLIVINYI